MQIMSNDSFTASIREQLARGYTFIPFVGSGLSSKSGILMGREFDDYLAYVVFRVIAPLEVQRIEKVAEAKVDLRKGWPQRPHESAVHVSKTWLLTRYKEILNTDYGLTISTPVTGFEESPGNYIGRGVHHSVPLTPKIFRPTPDHSEQEWFRENAARSAGHLDRLYTPHLDPVASPTSEKYIIEEGIRSLFDWRRTLKFLATVFPVDQNTAPSVRGRSFTRFSPSLDARGRQRTVDQSIVDDFNKFITDGRKPNLGHMSLAHLSRPMRFRQVLTTNFDTLIEDSFRRLKLFYKEVELHLNGAFPDPAILRNSPCIVKLHGSMHETRADPTLDEPPTEEDKCAFRHLVLGIDSGGVQSFLPSHLFVIGYSGSDGRQIQFFKNLLDHSEPGTTKIFWVAHSENTVKRLQRLFCENEYDKEIEVTVAERPDLLLYELYQELTYSLPGGGLSYEFLHKVPPEAGPLNDTSEKHIALEIDEILSERRRWTSTFHDINNTSSNVEFVRIYVSQGSKSENRGITYTLDMGSGVVRVMSTVYRSLTAKYRSCLWFELDDYSSPIHVLEDCIRNIAMEIGVYRSEHLKYSISEPCVEPSQLNRGSFVSPRVGELKKHFETVVRRLGITPNEWYIFLYGRNAPGTAAGWNDKPWTEVEYKDFKCVLDVLQYLGFVSVYMPYTRSRSERELMKREYVDSLFSTSANDPLDTQPGVGTSVQASPHPVEEFLVTDTSRKAKVIRDTLFASERKKKAVFSASKIKQLEPLWEKAAQVRDHSAAGRREEFYLFDPQKNEAYAEHLDSLVDQQAIKESCQQGIQKRWVQRVFEEKILLRVLAEWLCEGYSGQSVHTNAEELQNWTSRFQFLYAASLFRQPRHISAFYTEAVCPCPHRFNLTGTDNDSLRGQITRQWVHDLEELGVFFRKRGGYCWKYRDVRLSIRYFLEQFSPLILLSGIPSDSPPLIRSLDHAGQFRARTHQWIAMWYERAFMSTGNPSPLTESLYHRSECIRCSSFAKPTSVALGLSPYQSIGEASRKRYNATIALYRADLALASLRLMAKLLRIGRSSVMSWRPVSQHDNFFAERALTSLFVDGDSPLLALEDVSGQLGNNTFRSADGHSVRDRLRALPVFGSAIEDLMWSLEEFRKTGPRSVSMIDRSFASNTAARPHREERWRRIDKAFLDAPLISERTRSVAAKTKADIWRNWLRGSTGFTVDKVLEDLGGLPLLKKIDACIKETDEGIPAEVPLAATTPQGKGLGHEERLGMLFHRRSDGSMLPKNQDDLRLLVHLLGEMAYQYILRCRIEEAICKSQGAVACYPYASPRWIQVSILCNIGIDLCRHIDLNDVEYETSQLVKLHTLYGLALGRLGRHFEANRHFNDAMARLSKSDHGLEDVELGVIRLRRAETFCWQAQQILHLVERSRGCVTGLAPFDRGQPVLDLQKYWQSISADRFNRVFTEQNAGRTHVASMSSEPRDSNTLNKKNDEFFDWMIRGAISSLDDATVMMDSATDLLAGHNHTTLWWLNRHSLFLSIIQAAVSIVSVQRRHGSHIMPTIIGARRDIVGNMCVAFEQSLVLGQGDLYRTLRAIGDVQDTVSACLSEPFIVAGGGSSLRELQQYAKDKLGDIHTYALDEWNGTLVEEYIQLLKP
ncbi:MAG: SIR2 family protein [Rubinisphaera brasiliensis]|uniref:SIR2 family protein n=1 Tax=Rubinisphaera brasiliensis TaxID=119 RepID=UPI00391B50A9